MEGTRAEDTTSSIPRSCTHYTTLHCTALHCTALHCTFSHDKQHRKSRIMLAPRSGTWRSARIHRCPSAEPASGKSLSNTVPRCAESPIFNTAGAPRGGLADQIPRLPSHYTSSICPAGSSSPESKLPTELISSSDSLSLPASSAASLVAYLETYSAEACAE